MKRDEMNRMAVCVIALSVGVVASVMSMLYTGKPLYAGIIGGCCSFAAAVFGARMERNYRASLAERAEQPVEQRAEVEVMWEVRMNGVQVGLIADHDLAAVQGEIARDWRIWLAQLVNLLGVPLRIFDKVLDAIPVVAFWGIFALAIFNPSGLVQLFTAMRNASPHEIQQAAMSTSWGLIVCGFLACVVSGLWLGNTYGLRSKAREEMGHRLRRHLKIAAMGELTIERVADGRLVGYNPDMLGWLRSLSRSRSRRAESV